MAMKSGRRSFTLIEFSIIALGAFLAVLAAYWGFHQ